MESSGSTSSSWTWLPDPLLESILTSLNPLSGDYFRFGAVCKDWYKIMKNNRTLVRSSTQIPLLMIPSKKDNETKRSFYDITRSTRFDSLHPRVPYDVKACGSSNGWLIYVEKNMRIVLYNPFHKPRENRHNEGVIKLPPVIRRTDDVPHGNVRKAILFGNPSLTRNYVVVAFCRTNSGNLALWKSSSSKGRWIRPVDYRNEIRDGFTDAIMYKGLIYAVSAHKGIISIYPFTKEGDIKVKVKGILITNWPIVPRIQTYLVESTNGDLIVLRRILQKRHQYYIGNKKTSKFEVYKLNKTKQKYWLEQLDSLDGDTIFVGDGKSVCVAASDFNNCQPNSIYFTDDGFVRVPDDDDQDHHNGPCDTGIFSLQDRSIKPLYPYDLAHKYLPPAIWVTPMF